MPDFATARDAKEFLVSRIISEAQRENTPLSEVERKMLYFSETHWAPPDIWETNEAFDRDYNEPEYEAKIASLIRNLVAKDRKEDRVEYGVWKEAVRTLESEDHYLLVLIGIANGSLSMEGSTSPPLDFFEVLKIALTVSVTLAFLILIYLRFKG